MRVTVVGIVCCCLLGACSTRDDSATADSLTRRERDSALGQSGIPGAGGITKALGASDSAKARQARLDSASRP
jgi:hypothetical protein